MTVDPRSVTGRILIDGKLAGTAWRAGSELAVTAAHCLRVPLRTDHYERCQVAFADGGIATGIVRDLDALLDVAILRLDAPGRHVVTCASLPWNDSRVAGNVKQPWHGYGYPDAKPDGLGLNGTITHVGERDGRGIQLSCEQGGQGYLKHASGAPVIIGDRAVALIVWNPEPLAQKVIFARPLDQVARAFPYLKAPLHPRFREGNRELPHHLSCDRSSQWGQFRACIEAGPAVNVFFVHGPDREAPEKFIERIEHAGATDFQVRDVLWSGGLPPSAPVDYLAALSRGIDDDELDEARLVDKLVELSRETKLVVKHPLINISADSVRLRLDDLHTYYYETLPALFTRYGAFPQDFRGIVFTQPLYWELRGLARVISYFSDHRAWENRIRTHDARPLHPIIATDLTRITVDHVKDLLATVPELSDALRAALLRDVRHYRTSRDVLKFLQERVG